MEWGGSKLITSTCSVLMSTMEKTGKKRRKYSKKSKKNLRKYTDIRDVEEFLEEQRFQERTGGLVAEKKDEQLFFVQNKTPATTEDVRKTPKAVRRKRQLRSLSHLYRDPVISGINITTSTKKQQVSFGSSCGAEYGSIDDEKAKKLKKLSCLLNDGVIDSSEEEEEYDVSSRSAVKRRKERLELAVAVHKRLKKSALKPVAKDIWANDNDVVSEKEIQDEHFLRVTRKLPVKKPKSVGDKPSALASVTVPPPGASYNPAFDDHQELLRSAVDVEEARLVADQKINKRLEAMEPMTASEREEVWQKEMIEGLIEGTRVEERGEEETCVELPNKRPVLASSRKTARQRRREEERKIKEKQKIEVKMLKKRMNDLYRLRSLKKMIVQRESTVREKERLTQQLKEKEEPLQTKRLGKIPYMDPDIDVQLSSEISGALRTLKCEGNIARDRYKSLQKRNIIEPRQKIRPHRKYKLKFKEKRSARLPEEMNLRTFNESSNVYVPS